MAKKIFISAFVLSFLLFLPSLFSFFSHDDFFHLKISQAHNLVEFLSFFNILHAPEGFGFYRPATTQLYYFLFGWGSGLNPLIMHVVSFYVFSMNIYLVNKLTLKLSKNTLISAVTAFLYALSSTHFGHLYFLGTFQELGMAMFYFSSLLTFVIYLQNKQMKFLAGSIGCFLAALASKESAVTLPVVLFGFYILFKLKGFTEINWKSIILPIFTFFLILFVYLYLHIFYYGLAEGDSYIWSISPSIINTFTWYLLWSLNLPEMLVDYVGPGFKLNPNLLKFYSVWITPIIVSFIIELVIFTISLIQFLKAKKDLSYVIFGIIFFSITLSPVLFLPWHKFSFELTVPLYGITLAISYIIVKVGKKNWLMFLFLYFFVMTSIITNMLTYKVSWITQGGIVAKKVFNKIESQKNVEMIVFYDTEDDKDLPWSPTGQMKNILSDKNFFDVFYTNKYKIQYGSNNIQDNEKVLNIRSRQVLYE